MTTYKLQQIDGRDVAVTIIGINISFPFDPANTDYANFKAQVLADEAELQDADGNVMASEQAKEFVASLP